MLCTCIKMLRIDACWVITRVKNVEAIRHRAVVHLIGEHMRSNEFYVLLIKWTGKNNAIAVWIDAPDPVPALFWFCLGHLRPKTG